MTYAVGIDMGGTFTDGCFTDGRRAVIAKVPTTHFDLTRSVVACLTQGAELLGITLEALLDRVGLFRLATTIGTNSVVTGSGDPVGVMVEAGAESSLYGTVETSPAIGAFVRADCVAGVGASRQPEEVLTLCRNLIQRGVRQVVVSLRRGRRADEERLRGLVRRRYPAHYLRSIPLTLGSELCDAADDELRTATAVLNAYLSRPMAKLLYRTEGVLQQSGLGVPVLAVRSDGTCSRTARTTAVSTYSSGPAAGLGLVAAEARISDDAVAVGFDMGGTTLDLGLVRDGAYEVDPSPEIRGVRVGVPVPQVLSVGLGGSSIAAADAAGAVTVGPDSAGAVPGPAAFGRGGVAATLTDADVILGFLAHGQVLAGEITLDASRAAAALAPLANGDAVEAALRVRSAAHARAASAIGALLSGTGADPATATLYAFGGAGALHAAAVAERAGILRVRSFAHGGVFSARAVAGADIVQRYRADLAPSRDAADAVRKLVGRARLDLEAERLDGAKVNVDLCQAGGRRRSVAAVLDPEAAAAAVAADGAFVGDAAVRVEVTTVISGPASLAVAGARAEPPACRPVRWTGPPLDTEAAELAALDEGQVLDGPALIGASGTIHAVPPGWTARSRGGDLVWERSA